MNLVDIIPLARKNGLFIINNEIDLIEGLNDTFTFQPKVLAKHKLYLLLSKKNKKNKDIIKLFNKGLKLVKKLN
ncbi:MAG: hypothetical protein HN576_01480 [Bacteriovoracaceae bacterium]|jgi:hypothetical protein|nr:hypothetical protein [Bacteriovoracaceae bacterium]